MHDMVEKSGKKREALRALNLNAQVRVGASHQLGRARREREAHEVSVEERRQPRKHLRKRRQRSHIVVRVMVVHELQDDAQHAPTGRAEKTCER